MAPLRQRVRNLMKIKALDEYTTFGELLGTARRGGIGTQPGHRMIVPED